MRLFAVLLLASSGCLLPAGEWPALRGPHGNGIADPAQDPPVKLGKPKWAVNLQGEGQGSIVVKGGKLFLTTAMVNQRIEDGEVITGQYLVCLDRTDGNLLWAAEVHSDGLEQKLGEGESWAATTPVIEGDRVYVNFLNRKAVSTTAVDLDGNIQWQADVCAYTVTGGFRSNPIVYKDFVIVSADNVEESVVSGLEKETGIALWIDDRAKKPNYTSPALFKLGGKDQVVMTGTGRITSYVPETGEKLWEIDGRADTCFVSPVSDGTQLYINGGGAKNQVAAVRADGSGKVMWEVRESVSRSAFLLKDGLLHGVTDDGVAICWDASSGEEKWSLELGGKVNESPVLVDDKVYITNRSGQLIVYQVDPAGGEILAKNKVGDELYSSPAICHGEIYLRVGIVEDGQRSQKIVCYDK